MGTMHHNNETFGKEEFNSFISHMKMIFDIVRIVDPEECAVLSRNELAGDISDMRCKNDECYAVWEKNYRCENCISRRALMKKTQLLKFEAVNDDVFMIISKYMEVDGEDLVVEMVWKDREKTFLSLSDKTKLAGNIINYNKQLYTDVLTCVYNRRYYEEQVKNKKYSGGIAMIDADNFKTINDTYGHAIGDVVLYRIAKAIKTCIRRNDILIRYGGDEFVLVLEEIPEETFFNKIQEIDERVKRIRIPEMRDIKCSVSIGAVYDIDNVEKAVIEADKRMYEIKMKKKTHGR